MPSQVKLRITPKPAPPALPSFECVICQNEIERNPYRPDLEEPPVCFRCSIKVPTRPQIAGVSVEHLAIFYKAHAILCAIKSEIEHARRNH